MFVNSKHRDWDIHIPAILFGFRVSVCESTGDSPFYLLYGRECLLPLDISLIPPTDPSSSIAEHRRRIVSQIELSQEVARQNIQRAQQKMKEYYDRTAKEPTFEVDDRVWSFTPKTRKGLSKKLLHKWYGPYRLAERLSPVHFRVRTCDNRGVTTSVHVNRMKCYFDPADRPIEPLEDDLNEPYLEERDIEDASFQLVSTTPSSPSSQPVTRNHKTRKEKPKSTNPNSTESTPPIDNKTVSNAECLLKSRVRKGKTQYLVKWVGYDETTWENEDNILDKRLIENFNKANLTSSL